MISAQGEKGKTMTRLIDADRLRDDFLAMPNCYNGFSDSYDKAMIVDMVDEQPTIDAVPVVLCKDCKWGREVCGNIECSVDMYEPVEYHGYEWFCPLGERKEK